jgi:hypothetical protein
LGNLGFYLAKRRFDPETGGTLMAAAAVRDGNGGDIYRTI